MGTQYTKYLNELFPSSAQYSYKGCYYTHFKDEKTVV